MTLTGHESAEDCRRAYELALQVHRLRLLMSGEVLPIEGDEKRVDIVIMAAIR